MNRDARAKVLSGFDSLAAAVAGGALPQFQDISLAEAIVLGLWNQGVRRYAGIFGHGTTDIAEVLRVYEGCRLLKMYNLRHETAAAHAATAAKWLGGGDVAVITSIGPGALHAFAGSLAAASNNIGVWHIYGDETSGDEGFNMQQIPKDEQFGFLKTFERMGSAYTLQDPLSIFTALRRGAVLTGRRAGAAPYFLLAPMNKQPEIIRGCNLLEFPGAYQEPAMQCADEQVYARACEAIAKAERSTIKYGRGALGCGNELAELARLIDAAIVGGPSAGGVVPFSNPRYMTVGGSKGSSAGNYAMAEADLVIVVGARAVCQWDSSGTAFKKASSIININLNSHHAFHYNRSISITGDAKSCLAALIAALKQRGFQPAGGDSPWAKSLFAKRAEWLAWKNKITECEPLYDETFQTPVLTQPAAIAQACRFAERMGAVKFFDAGDVQANGFQIVEDEKEGQTVTDTGSSYMGFAASALLAPVISGNGQRYAFAFCGDGSFMMNPQVLMDGVEHGVKGCIIIFDNRSMAAIGGLQKAQYGAEYKTKDSVQVDYAALASAVQGVQGIYGGNTRDEFAAALQRAAAYEGLSVIHLPVYSGGDPAGGMGVFGDWNVGNWCERVQAEHHKLGL